MFLDCEFNLIYIIEGDVFIYKINTYIYIYINKKILQRNISCYLFSICNLLFEFEFYIFELTCLNFMPKWNINDYMQVSDIFLYKFLYKFVCLYLS